MPSHQQNLDRIRAACVRANPEINPLKTVAHIETVNGKPVLGRDITLPDVLLALGENRRKPSPSNLSVGLTVDLSGGELFIHQHEAGRNGEAWWDLRQPLSGQSEETVAYIASLLTK